MWTDITKKLVYTQFLQRENFTRHHRYDEEMLQYEYIKNGDPRGIDAAEKMFSSNLVGKLSEDPLRNIQYLFVCSITLITRFAIEGGMEPETAYNKSDLYIQSMDKCKSVDEVHALHKQMTTHFVKHTSNVKKENVYSRPVVNCLDYIYEHLHESIKVYDLASETGLNPTYLSTLFKKEMGMPISEYIRRRRVEAAENMLKYSDYALTEIAEYLAFSSYSHFADIFRRQTGYTPKEYRKKFFRKTSLIEI